MRSEIHTERLGLAAHSYVTKSTSGSETIRPSSIINKFSTAAQKEEHSLAAGSGLAAGLRIGLLAAVAILAENGLSVVDQLCKQAPLQLIKVFEEPHGERTGI